MPGPVFVKARCPRCTSVVSVPAGVLACAVPDDAGDGLGEFVCPECRDDVFVDLPRPIVQWLMDRGARPFDGTVPFELLETHLGAPISEADLRRCRRYLELTDVPQVELS